MLIHVGECPTNGAMPPQASTIGLTAMANHTLSLSHFDAEFLRDPYSCFSAEDLVPEPPDPFWESALERFGPLDPAITAGPRRYATSYDSEGRLPYFEVYQGNALEVLKLLAGQAAVHSVITSVLYYCLRHYGDRTEELGWGSLEHYLASLGDGFDAVPLHRRGSIWVNIGDTRGKGGGLLGVPERFMVSMQDRGSVLPKSVDRAGE
jgi:hypothetical protein